jgi:hypothetical protein
MFNREVIMRFLWMVLVALIVPSVSLAGYQVPENIEKVRLSSGQTKAKFEFKGSAAGEPTVIREYVSSQGATNQSVREWVADTIAELDRLQTVDTLPALQLGAKPTPANRASAAKTAKQVWQSNASTCAQYKGVFTGKLGEDVDAMCADAQATYQAGFLTE